MHTHSTHATQFDYLLVVVVVVGGVLIKPRATAAVGLLAFQVQQRLAVHRCRSPQIDPSHPSRHTFSRMAYNRRNCNYRPANGACERFSPSTHTHTHCDVTAVPRTIYGVYILYCSQHNAPAGGGAFMVRFSVGGRAVAVAASQPTIATLASAQAPRQQAAHGDASASSSASEQCQHGNAGECRRNDGGGGSGDATKGLCRL